MQTAAVKKTTAASGTEDTGRCVICAQREWQFSVLILKIVTFLSDVVRVFFVERLSVKSVRLVKSQ
jgi:hypothetical protein